LQKPRFLQTAVEKAMDGFFNCLKIEGTVKDGRLIREPGNGFNLNGG
jgi:hypothetical protein